VRFFLLALLQCCLLARAASPDLVNGIAVIVGEAVITYKDIQVALNDDLEFLERRFGNQPQVFAQKAAELEKAKLEEMVENQLVLQEFKTAGYVVPESYFQSRIDEDIRKFGDRLTLTKTLQAQGITFETYRNRVRERVILQLMYNQKVPNEPLISPTKIENYYQENRDKFKLQDQVKMRMIVVTNSPMYSAKGIAREISLKLDEKVSFDELARVYSMEPQAVEGGARGWLEKTALRKEIGDTAFGLEAGQHSQPVETPDGFFILFIEEKKVSYVKTLAETRDEIEAKLKADETKRLRQEWIGQLKRKAFVRYF